MRVKEYEVVVKCGVLMTTSKVSVSAASPEEAVRAVRNSKPSSFIVGVSEVTDEQVCDSPLAVACGDGS